MLKNFIEQNRVVMFDQQQIIEELEIKCKDYNEENEELTI